MRKLFCLIILGGAMSLLVVGCNDCKLSETTTVELTQSKASGTTTDQMLGGDIRIEFITAEDILVSTISIEDRHRKRGKVVQRRLEAFVNSGQYEIVKISTTRCNSSEAHLLFAEVYYRPKK